MKEMVWEAFLKDWDQYAGLELELQKKLALRKILRRVIAYSEKRRPQFKGK